MKNYMIHIGGSIAVKVIEFEDAFIGDNSAVEWATRNLKYYYPTYHNITIFRMNEDGVWVLVAEVKAEVVTSVVAGLMYPRKPE